MTRSRSFHEEFPVTAFLLLFNLAFFALEFIANSKIQNGGGGGFFALFQRMMHWQVLENLGSLSPRKITSGEYWRLISCTFLHWNLIHLACNGLFLFSVGRLAEPLMSRWRFLSIYTACGLGSSLTSYFLLRGHSAGASGALCGLIGALFAYSIRHKDRLLRDSLSRTIVLMIFISLLPFVDWAGHAGGFAVGCVFGWFTSAYTTSTSAARWRYPGYVAAVLVAGCLIMALRNYFFRDAGF